MKTTQELQQGMAHFYGSEGLLFNPLYSWMQYTDGVKFFFENAGGGAYWLSDILGTELQALSRKEHFLAVHLEVTNSASILFADDGNEGPALYIRQIEYTDCPEGTWSFYLISQTPTESVLMLPSEY